MDKEFVAKLHEFVGSNLKSDEIIADIAKEYLKNLDSSFTDIQKEKLQSVLLQFGKQVSSEVITSSLLTFQQLGFFELINDSSQQ